MLRLQPQGDIMKTSIPRAVALAPALIVVLGWIGPAAANPTFTTFDVPGAVEIYPLGIANNRIAGTWWDGTTYHGFLRKPNGNIVTFDPSGSTATAVCCINASGEIAGSYSDASSRHGFIRHAGGGITSFDPPNGDGEVKVGGINSGGAVSGDDGFTEFFLRDSGGNFTEFQLDNGAVKYVGGINDAGYMTGTTQFLCSPDCSTASGFIREPNGNITQFIVPGDTYTFGVAIDQNRRITGSYGLPDQNHGGYVRRPDGMFSTFAYAGKSIDYGKVTGSFQNAQGHERGFIRTPNGNINIFHVPGSTDTYAASISNGIVTGYYFDANNVAHGHFRTP